jgi:ribosomal protein S21
MSDSNGSSVAAELFGDESFSGWCVNDEPHVLADDFAADEGVDEMLEELSRRCWKSGRLCEYKQSRRYMKPSDQRRREKQAQAHRAETGSRRRWRGGVEP